MNKQWIPISLVTILGITAVLGLGVASIANKITYDVLSWQVQVLDAEGVTFKVVFAVVNPSGYDIDIWNQTYDVFVAGYPTLKIDSKETHRIYAATISPVPLEIRLTWEQISKVASPVNSLAQVTTYENLPIVIKGRLSVRTQLMKIKTLPVRMSAPLSDFLP